MEIKFDFFSIVSIIGIFISLFLSLIIATVKKSNKKANFFLALFLVAVSVTIFGFGILMRTNLFHYTPHLTNISMPCMLLLCPLLIFYVKALIYSDYKFEKKELLHFIPFILMLIYLVPFYIQSGEYKINFVKSWLEDSVDFKNLLFQYTAFSFIGIQIFSYLIYMWISLSCYEKEIKNSFSSIEKNNLHWLKHFIIIFFIAIFIMLVIFIMQMFIINFKDVYEFIPLTASVLIAFLVYRVLVQPEVITGIEYKSSIQSKNKPYIYDNKEKYKILIIESMTKKKLYREPDLTLIDLAARLDMSRNLLSSVINDCIKMNFYDFVNGYRVEEVKNFLENKAEKNFNIINIAMDAGFNSKTTFNAIFKKHTGMTPTQYWKNHKMRKIIVHS